LSPEEGVVVAAVLRGLRGQVEHGLHHLLPDGPGQARVLEELAAHVERQILGVHDAAHEAEPFREHLLRVLHHEHALHVETQAVLAVRREQIERRSRRDEDDARELGGALDLEVLVRERRLPVVREVLVELLVLLLGHVLGRPLPERGALVHPTIDGFRFLLALGLQLDRPGEVVAVLADDTPAFPAS